MNGKPELIAIDHDNYHAQHIGTTKDGLQFFLTTPFEPGIAEYIALFKFDALGNLVDSDIEPLGPRSSFSVDEAKAKYSSKLESLGNISLERIEVKPFSVELNGTKFGLIAIEPEDEDDIWSVELLPGNYMAFFEPWDSGVYDT
ncbi:hypothetical protein Misp06_00029 [Microbulbifer sp. NBRC 101763]|uniref:hypothetical protein n=1 Tax=Microbulbifer sp. NBRC 101763 TaxID=1113820 RepID=UPI00309E7BFC